MKPRILFLTPLPPPVHGSAMVSQYIKDSKLIANEFDCDFVNISTSRSIAEISHGSIAKVFRMAGILGRLVGKVLTHRYDLCYIAPTCHGKGFIKDAPLALLGKLFCGHLVIHQHNKGMSEDSGKWQYRWLLKWVYGGADVILLSNHLYPDIAAIVPEDKVITCPNGIPEKAAPERESHDIINVLFLSNLIASKGVYDLIDACEILNHRGLSFKCTFAGNESDEIGRNEFEAAVMQRGLEGIVSFVGPKYGDDKVKSFCQADIFAFPTYYDCFPLTLLEAMQHSLPVVTTDEGGILDIVEDGVTGLIVNKKDPQDLADKLETLINNAPLRTNMGAAGRKRYEENFTLGKWEQNMLDCLKKCLK